MAIYDEIRDAIIEAGGTPYITGGAARDFVAGVPYADIDTEVHGMDYDAVLAVLRRFGRADIVGRSYGVIKLYVGGESFDFTLPRRERKIAAGHAGFAVDVDAGMTLAEAMARRDFTVNAIYIAADGSIVDLFGGVDDLAARRLRHTSERFAEDPLRVLRGMQFAGRFGMSVARDTARLCRSLRNEYAALSIERVWGEWEKWASKSVRPSAGLEFLVSTGWVYLYPEIAALMGVRQDPEWHPEGSAYIHTKNVVDAAMAIARREALSDTERITLMLAALCHDFGKPATTVVGERSGRWVAPGHAEAGAEPARRFLESIGAPARIILAVVELVTYHMRHIGFAGGRAARRLAADMKATTPRMLGLLMEADASGRPWTGEFIVPAEAVAFIAEMETAVEAVQPILMGRHLKDHMRPGPDMGNVLRAVHAAQIEGAVQDFASAMALAMSLIAA